MKLDEMAGIGQAGGALKWRGHSIEIVSDDREFMTVSVDGKPFRIEKTDNNTFNDASHEVYYKYRGKDVTIENASFIVHDGFAEFVGCDTVVDDEGEELDEATQEKIKKQFGGFQFPKLEKILTNKRYLDISAYYAEDELGETFIFDDDRTLEETEADSVIAKIGYFFEGFYFSGRNLKIVRGNSMAGKYQEVQEANVSARPNRRQHLILDTEYGEVMLVQNGDYCEAYIGDNYDDYVGDVDCNLSDSETVIRRKISELFS